MTRPMDRLSFADRYESSFRLSRSSVWKDDVSRDEVIVSKEEVIVSKEEVETGVWCLHMQVAAGDA